MDRPGATKGQLGAWRWERLPTSYPIVNYWYRPSWDTAAEFPWVGVVKISGPQDAEFLLFSFLHSTGEIGEVYLASTDNAELLDRFARELHALFHQPVKERILIEVFGGHRVTLSTNDDEPVVLPHGLKQDVEEQTYTFFEQAEVYHRFGLRHRRGFLLVGPPGNGKTMMLRHLVRQCHKRYQVSAAMLAISRITDEEMVYRVFGYAAAHAPALLILEDMDSLGTETCVTRASVLAELDGLVSREGILVVATTNNPAQIDPALVHRPSRFDRVWHFPLPDEALRRTYLQWVLEQADESLLEWLVRETEGWSFAYLKELRVTTLIMSLNRSNAQWSVEQLLEAHRLLAAQFQAGKRNHAEPAEVSHVGFKAA
jgi:hypothetical protein